MKNPIQKTTIVQLKISRGIKRKMVLEVGDIGGYPTMYVNLKTVYNRNQKKKNLSER